MPKKFDQEAKDRVVRLIEDRILAEGLSIQEACRVVAPKLGAPWHTARQWVQEARKTGRVMRAEEDIIAENARLRRENQELRDTNELLKAASAFFAKIVRRVHAENYGVYGVRKMWHALTRQGINIGREQTRRIMALSLIHI